jgi:hypothetical protein
MRKSGKKKKPKDEGPTTQPVVEEGDDESSVDSLMAESPTKYAKAIEGAGGVSGGDEIGPGTGELSRVINENDLIDKVTQKKIPKKKPPQPLTKIGVDTKPKAP